MTDPKIVQQRQKGFYERDFSPTANISAELRIAAAIEYAAFQLGQINRKLDVLIGDKNGGS